MSTPLLTTKFYFPSARPNLVPRPQLIERLEEGLKGTLTLISAPAGYGKTTLMSEWRLGHGKDVPVAWLSLDTDDNDLTRFLQYLTTALEILQPGLAEAVQPLLQVSEMPNAEAVLTHLINRLSNLKLESILVLDDYHLIELPSIQKSLHFLLDHLPARLHLVLLTRSNPAFTLARLRARGLLAEIRANDLRFNREDTARFLNHVLSLNLSEEQISALERRTEGWIASLQLVALSLRGREDIQSFISAFTGSHHYIMDYLVEEVLSHQRQTVRDFLVKTSILDRLTGPLCDAVTGDEDGATTLAMLDHSNLFIIPLDNNQTWYRYHHLFADLLRNHLQHYPPEVIKQMHIQAAEWFEQNDLVDEALSHTLSAKDFDRAIRLFCRNELDIIYARNLSTLDRWLKAFPDAVLLSNPWLCIAKAHVLWSIGQREGIKPYVQAAERSLVARLEAGQISSTDYQYLALQGDIITLRSLVAMDERNLALAITLAQEAVSTTPTTARSRTFALGSLYIAYDLSGEIEKGIETCLEAVGAAKALDYPSMLASSAYSLAALLRVKGQLNRADKILHECLEYAELRGLTHVFYYGILYVAMAETIYEWNALDQVESLLEKGLKLCQQGGMNIFIPDGLYMSALVHHARGDYQGALNTLNEIERECKEMDPRAYQEGCISLKLRIHAELGDISGSAEWLQSIDLSVEDKISTIRFTQLYRASWILNVLDKSDEALRILNKLELISRHAQYTGWLVYILALEAVILKKRHDHKRAMQCLYQALEIAESERYVRVFLNQGQPMKELLLKAKMQAFKPEFTSHILAGYELGLTSPRTTPSMPTILSKREVELLRLISAGRSNKEIASELFISVGTVKRHTANIFDKLDVQNRTEAVARARELNLLS